MASTRAAKLVALRPMGDIGAAGDIITGALVARAVEPGGGSTGHHGHHGDSPDLCLNCGTRLVGDHCHACGQAAHVHRSLGAIGHEILHGVAHFEGKLWRTLPLLLWRPGVLTRRYIAGERVRFVSPMALFLFGVFTMFAVFSIVGLSPPADIHAATEMPRATLQKQLDDARFRRETAVKARENARNDTASRASIDRQIAQADKDIASANETIRALDESKLDIDLGEPHTGWARLDHGIEKWKKNPSLMLYKLQSNSYKFSWLLIPLSIPFVWMLFFWKRQYHLYDHAVFVTYSLSFMTLLFIGITIAAELGVGSKVLTSIATFVPPVHIAVQLKQAYRLNWLSALLRTAVLGFFIAIILTLFAILLILLGTVG